jgi:hypothetical protein
VSAGAVLHEPAAEGGLQDAHRVGRQSEVCGARPPAGLSRASVQRQTRRHQEAN